ncbi:MAG: AI-2E family transporter [Desulfobulbaceae bacterium]|nr:AI-2E family transporter [Desulfobulbaceae bacterium]
MPIQKLDDSKFLALFTLVLIAASLWIFSSYLHFILVAAVLALATSHVFTALTQFIDDRWGAKWPGRNRHLIVTTLLTSFFLLLIFGPLLYFISVTYEQVNNLDLAQIKQTVLEIVDKAITFLEGIPLLQEPLSRVKSEGMSFISGPAIEVAFEWLKGFVSGAGGLFIQIVWILIFYFLFNFYGKSILMFLSSLLPLSSEHEEYMYRECTGTVSVVFYGTLFNMIAQGCAFGLLMVFIGGYNAGYLGVLAGFCSVIPIVGSALVYVPVIALELLAGHYISAVVILVFAWVVMGFFIDNILRLFFIGFLKKLFGFVYTMNEILILLAILAGIATFGFWGLIIGPSILALTLATTHLYSTQIKR